MYPLVRALTSDVPDAPGEDGGVEESDNAGVAFAGEKRDVVVQETPEPGEFRTGPGFREPVGGQGLGHSVCLVLSRKALKVRSRAGNRNHDVPLEVAAATAVVDQRALGQDLVHGADQGLVSG